jgi:hypothetical protein
MDIAVYARLTPCEARGPPAEDARPYQSRRVSSITRTRREERSNGAIQSRRLAE